jgi:hypothetical protein
MERPSRRQSPKVAADPASAPTDFIHQSNDLASLPASSYLVKYSATTRKESETRTPDVPTLAQMVRDGRADAEKHKQRSEEALELWFRQSERLNIARTHYELRGDEFKDFAASIGVDRSTGFALVKLLKHRAAIMSRCRDEADKAAKRGDVYHFPGWWTALSWFEKKRWRTLRSADDGKKNNYWLTPPELRQSLNAEFHFDFDPCPYPLPSGWDALAMPWGRSNYVNAPFSRHDGPGLTAFVRKAIAEQEQGKTSVLIIPLPEMVNLLIEAGEMRRIGRVPFIDIETGERCPHPGTCTAFVLWGRGTKR